MGNGIASGLAIVAGAAVVNGSFTTPMKYILAHNKNNPWQWEHIWLLYSVGYLLFTWVGAFAFIGSEALIATYRHTSGADLVLPMLFAFGWGIGSSLLGCALMSLLRTRKLKAEDIRIGIDYVGLSIGFSLVLGLTAGIGSLGVMLSLHPGDVLESKGLLTIAGVCVILLGLVLVGYAGHSRDQRAKQQKSAGGEEAAGEEMDDFYSRSTEGVEGPEPEEKLHAPSPTLHERRFALGIMVCIFSGFTSPMINFALAFGGGIESFLRTQYHVSDTLSSLGLWALTVGTTGFLGNALYAIYLLTRNQTWHMFVGPPSKGYVRVVGLATENARANKQRWLFWILSLLLMGLTWYVGLVLFGLGSSPKYLHDPAISWPIFMSVTIITANVWAVVFGEWKDSARSHKAIMFAGLLLLIVAVCIIGAASRF